MITLSLDENKLRKTVKYIYHLEIIAESNNYRTLYDDDIQDILTVLHSSSPQNEDILKELENDKEAYPDD